MVLPMIDPARVVNIPQPFKRPEKRGRIVWLHPYELPLSCMIAGSFIVRRIMNPNALNVPGQPLLPCPYDPLTGYFRDGCCNTREDDCQRVACHLRPHDGGIPAVLRAPEVRGQP